MASRKRIHNVAKDKAIFRRTAARKNTKNLPGHQMRRGGEYL